MFLTDTSVKRPVLATVASLVLVVLGLASAGRLEVRQYPDVDPPVVSISTTYRGAPPEVVDADITKRIIDQLSGVEGIRLIDATSSEASSNIDVEFELSRDLDLAAADVRDRVARVRSQLPDGIDDPVVSKASADSQPIMWISLTSETWDRLQLTDYADRVLAENLAIVDGVASIRIGGERRQAVRIWLNPEEMAARAITVPDIVSRLRAENVEVPAGRLESKAREFSLRITSRLSTPEEFRDLVIRDDGGARVRLGDIARIELGAEEERNYFLVNGKAAVGLGIIRQSDANTVEVAENVKRELARLEPTFPEAVTLSMSFDSSLFIKASIREVVVSLTIAIGLVVAVILVFTGSVRASLLPIVSIPVALTATMTVLYALGFSINVLTLLAGVLAIGLLVDDAIVVLENIERRIRGGESPLEAAFKGSRQVGFAVIATTVVLVAVFVPIAFLTGRVGRLFTEFAITIAVSVAFSSFVALTLGPVICAKVLKAGKKKDGTGGKKRKGPVGRALAAVSALYARAVGWSIAARWVFPVVTAGVVAYAGWLLVRLPGEVAPTEDQGSFLIFIESPEGASIEYTASQVDRVLEEIRAYDPEEEIVNRTISIVPGFGGGGRSVSRGVVIARMPDWSERDVSQQQAVRDLFPRLAALPGAVVFPVNRPSLGVRSATQPVQVAVGGPDFESAQRWSQELFDAAKGDPAIMNLKSDYDPTQPRITVNVDRAKASNVGVDISDIGVALQTFFGGLEVTDYFDRGELYEVILRADAPDRSGPADFEKVYLRGSSGVGAGGGDGPGALVPLSNLITLEETGVVRELKRINRLPSVQLTASVAPDSSLGDALDMVQERAAAILPDRAQLNFLGPSLEYIESSATLYVTFGLALVLVYLVLAAQFESFADPVTILITVPLAAAGGLTAIWASGDSLNIYTQIGLVMMIGLTAKNGILMVEFANQLRREGKELREAAVEASVIRLRPILMTAISTILGAVPLVLASGAGAEGRRAIGWVVVGGMSFSALLTLFITPAVYVILGRLTDPAHSAEAKLAEAGVVTREGAVAG